MSAKRGGLGRSLSALLANMDESIVVENTQHVNESMLMTLPVAALQPGQYQPRGAMDETGLQELTASVKQQGLLQPIVVRELSPGHYEIIAGERRWRACQLADITDVPVLVRQVNDETAMALALIENLQREALSVMDEARAMQRLSQEFSLTHVDIARLLSKSRAAVSNCLRLLNLSDVVKAMLDDGKLDMGHARCLLRLNEAEQARVAEWVVNRRLSVRETEALVARVKANPSNVSSPKSACASGTQFQDELKQLSAYLDTKVQLKPGASGQGKLLIQFKNTEHLEQMLAALRAAQSYDAEVMA
ncbi:MAG: ParB/RepB/Spo0J family partition protein [Legionella sp.]|nr:ParB/RepB/Spo0J family partition protein [Legionella sp.]